MHILLLPWNSRVKIRLRANSLIKHTHTHASMFKCGCIQYSVCAVPSSSASSMSRSSLFYIYMIWMDNNIPVFFVCRIFSLLNLQVHLNAWTCLPIKMLFSSMENSIILSHASMDGVHFCYKYLLLRNAVV